MKKVLVVCESYGRTRDAFRARGFDAYSCDLLPTVLPGPHFQCDAREIVTEEWQQQYWRWDLIICHPDCTYLTNSAAWAYGDGPYHQKVKEGTLVGAARRAAREQALEFVQFLMDAPVPLIAIENPVGVISTRIRPADQYIHPYQFGDDASKKTGLWLKGLPKLQALPEDQWVKPRYVNGRPRWANQTDSGQNRLSPGPDRWRERSATYQGWSDAMADQWGKFLLEQAA